MLSDMQQYDNFLFFLYWCHCKVYSKTVIYNTVAAAQTQRKEVALCHVSTELDDSVYSKLFKVSVK